VSENPKTVLRLLKLEIYMLNDATVSLLNDSYANQSTPYPAR